MDRERLDISQVGELSLGEMEILEERTGMPLSRLQADPETHRVKLARAMGLIMLRRRARAQGEPEPTWEDAGELLLPEVADDDGDGVGEVGTTAPDPMPAGRRKRRG